MIPLSLSQFVVLMALAGLGAMQVLLVGFLALVVTIKIMKGTGQ
jgi:hypothetical protein